MSIDFPRHIKIGPVKFSLNRVKRIGRNYRTWGQINHYRAAIKVRGEMNTQHQAVTLMHEVIHGTLTSIGRNDLNEDEVFVEQLSESIMDTLWNSPGLMRYFKEANR